MTKPGYVEIEISRVRTCQDHQTRSREDIALSNVEVEKFCDESAIETLARWMLEQDVIDKRRVVDDDGTVHMYYYLTVIMPPKQPAVLTLVPSANRKGKDDE